MATEKKTTAKKEPKKTSTKKPVSKSSASAKKEAKAPKSKVAKKAPAKKTDLFAVIETGGKQYRVQEGDLVSIEKLSDSKVGDTVEFESVLLIDDGSKTVLGNPTIKGKKVTAKITEEGKGKKIHVVRFKSKSRYYKKTGHRQPYMKAEIVKIG